MAVKIADTLKALSNTFPVAECVDIDVNINGTTKRLQKAIDDGEIGGGSDSTWKGTHEEWEALSTEEKGKYEVICFTDDYDSSGIGESDSTWKGTKEEWEGLSTEEKGKYEIVYFTDDYDDSGICGSDSSWKGTLEEWEALSPEEKGKYEVVYLTNDYDDSRLIDDIVDNLTSTDTNKPLSAKQGKVLKDEIGLKANSTDLTSHTSDTSIHITTAERTKWNKVNNKVDKTDIVDNLTSTNTDKPLSANQGKILKGEIGLKVNATDLTTHTNDTNIHITSAERTLWNTVSNKADTSQIHTHSNKTVLDKITEANVKTMNDVASGIGGRNRTLNTHIPITLTDFKGNVNYTSTRYTTLLSGLIANEPVTISFDFTYTGLRYNGNKSIHLQGSGDVTGWDEGALYYSFTNLIDWSTGTGTLKVKYTFNISSDLMKNTKLNFEFRTDNITSGSFTVSNFKVEKGTIATDWTPAPEDMPTNSVTTIDSTSTNSQVPTAKSVYNLAGNENRRGYVYNNPTYRGNKWNRVFRVNSLLSCDSGFLTVTVYSNGLCQIATFLMSKNFNRLNIKQINCGGYNGDKGQSRPIKVRIVSAETIGYSFLEIYVSGTSNTNVVATYMPLSCNSVVVLNEEGSIPSGMFACEMTATHDTYENATYTSILK